MALPRFFLPLPTRKAPCFSYGECVNDNKVEAITFEKETAKFYVNRICNGRKYIIKLNKSRSGYYKTAEDAIQARISYLESKIEDANKEIVMLKGTKTQS